MSDGDKFAIAARLYVQLRRKTNRSIDTVWMIHNGEYAREVLRMAREQADDDLLMLAGQFEKLIGTAPPAAAPVDSAPVAMKSYIGTLR